MSRPKKKFSEREIEQIEAMAKCHCPDEEIAGFLGCTESTLKRRFGPVLKEMRKAGRAALRARQFKLAMEGNTTLLIWLGKQILGQRDKNDIQMNAEISGSQGRPIEISLQDSVKNLLTSEDGLEILGKLDAICEHKG